MNPIGAAVSFVFLNLEFGIACCNIFLLLVFLTGIDFAFIPVLRGTRIEGAGRIEKSSIGLSFFFFTGNLQVQLWP